MPSATGCGSNLPRSPMLEQPDTTSSESTAQTAAGLTSRRHRLRVDIGPRRLATPKPPTAAVLRRRMRLRFGLLGFRIHVTLDPNNRQNDDRRGFRGVTPKTHNAPLGREFDDVTHHHPPAVFLCRKLRSTPCAGVG